MKKILVALLLVLIATTISAQNQKVRVGLFKKWYVGAFDEIIGKYSTEMVTSTDDTEEDYSEFFDFEKYSLDNYDYAVSSCKVVKRDNDRWVCQTYVEFIDKVGKMTPGIGQKSAQWFDGSIRGYLKKQFSPIKQQ